MCKRSPKQDSKKNMCKRSPKKDSEKNMCKRSPKKDSEKNMCKRSPKKVRGKICAKGHLKNIRRKVCAKGHLKQIRRKICAKRWRNYPIWRHLKSSGSLSMKMYPLSSFWLEMRPDSMAVKKVSWILEKRIGYTSRQLNLTTQSIKRVKLPVNINPLSLLPNIPTTTSVVILDDIFRIRIHIRILHEFFLIFLT